MRWRSNLRLSQRALSRSAGRTLLSVGAVAVGVASVVLLIGAGLGAERALAAALEPLGNNLLVVSPARSETTALRGAARPATTLLPEDAAAIEREIAGVRHVAPVVELGVLVSAQGRTVQQRLTGTTPSYQPARNFELVAGRFLDATDVEEARRVAVVGPMVVGGLFEGELPLGETLMVDGVPFRVVGVTAKKGVALNGANEDEHLFVPLTAAIRRVRNLEYLTRIFVQADTEGELGEVVGRIDALLRWRHGMGGGRADDFGIQDQTAIVQAQQASGRPLQRWIPGLAILTLALGGFGLLAVSVLSVRERHAEIGVRLAVGALPRDIAAQFFIEAMLVSILGGMGGLVLGAGGIGAGSALTSWAMGWSWRFVVYALGVSVAIAALFGSYPALRAARLDPIQALRGR